MTPGEHLSLALAALAERRRTTPCAADPGPWLSDDPRHRAEAATRCIPCPVLLECAAAADDALVRFGVWGGRDRTAQPRRKASA